MKSHSALLGAFVLLSSILTAEPTLEQLAADPALWPKEVTVTVATKGTLIRDGQPGGMILVGAGKKITVTAIAPAGVTGKLGGDTVRVPVDKTDLLRGGATSQPEAAGAGPTVADAPAAPRPVAATAPSGASRMQRQLHNRLVRLEGGKLTSLNTGKALVGVKYYALYFSASWCGPCREFTPHLVKAYRELKQKHPEFELIFMSNDRSAGEMADYMKKDAMPWPAVQFDQVGEGELMRYAGPGIPCLVLVDANGKVLADSFQGDNYLGPGHVMDQTYRILAKAR